MKTEYEKALAVHSAAIAAYVIAVAAYRARTIGDAQYLAARKLKAEADVVFDAAYAVAS
jgi:hypothetical protein